MTRDAALEDARPDSFGVRWAVAHSGRITYLCVRYPDGTCEYSRQWMDTRIRGRTIPESELPQRLAWMPLAVDRLQAVA